MQLPTRPLNAKVLTLWQVTNVLVALLATLLFGFTIWLIFAETPETGDIFPASVIFSFLCLSTFIAIALARLRYRRWRYELRPNDVFISRGTVFQRLTVVPFDRIQYVESRQGPLDRRFQMAKVLVYTAAGLGAMIPGLSSQDAQLLRDQLSDVAGTTSV